MSSSVLHGTDFVSFASAYSLSVQAAVDGPLPHPDVVLLAAGEVVQRERELLVGDDPQVGVQRHLRAVDVQRRDHARLGRPLPEHLHHFRQRHERVHDRLRVGGCSPGCRGPRPSPCGGGGCRTTRRGSRRGTSGCCSRSARPSGSAWSMRTRLPTLSRNAIPSRIFAWVFAPKPFCFATSPDSHAAFSFSIDVDAECVVKRLHLLRPQPRQAEHRHQPGGNRGAQVVEVRQRAGGDERGDLLGEGFADAADVSESVPSATICLRSPGKLLNEPRRVVVGVGAEGVLALQFEQGADLVERVGHVVFGHRWKLLARLV